MLPQEFSENFPFLNSHIQTQRQQQDLQCRQVFRTPDPSTCSAHSHVNGDSKRVVATRTTLPAIAARGCPSNCLRQILSGRVCPSKSEKGRKKLLGLLTMKEKAPTLRADSSHNSLCF